MVEVGIENGVDGLERRRPRLEIERRRDEIQSMQGRTVVTREYDARIA